MKSVRITLRNSFDEIVYCIISKDNNRKEEFEKVLSLRSGQGFCVECYQNRIELKDYFAGETRVTFKIIKEEDSNEEVQYYFTKIEG